MKTLKVGIADKKIVGIPKMTNLRGKHFYFVRHGETYWNALHLCQGSQDIELTERGRLDSIEFAKKLSMIPINCICTSPLKRAFQTAELIHRVHPIAEFQRIDELQERSWGELEGASSEKMYEMEQKEESDPDFVSGFGIEERSKFKERIIKGLNKSFECHSFPLIVSHGRVFLTLCEILGLPLIRQIPNLKLVEVQHDGSKWACQAL